MIKKIKYSALAIAAAAMLQSCGGSSDKGAQQAQQDSVKVEVVAVKTIEKKEVMRLLNFSGVLQAWDKVNIAPALQGRIVAINAEVGDRVQKGQLLAKMDETQYISQKIAVENLRTDFNRYKILNDSNNIAKQAFDQAKAGLDVQETALKNLENNTYLKAPFSGVISAKNYETGELFGGTPIFELLQLSTLKALVEVPESYFPFIKEGMKLNIKSETYPGQSFPATIDVVYPTIDANSHTFTIKVKVPNSSNALRPGMYINTDLELGKAQAISVPYNCVQKLQGSDERFVFLNDNGKAQRVVVKLGQRFDDEVEIIADDIKEGREIVVQGMARLHQDTPIKIKK